MKAFKAESQHLLDLVINSIYTNHEVFLRELISNASDALDKARLARREAGFEAEAEERIHVSFDKDARTLTVSDSGIGMDAEALESCLGTIAHSDSGELKGRIARSEKIGEEDAVGLIGQFGVGFYSSFMVADHVTVVSRAYGSDEAFCWESNGVDGYTVSESQRESCGTDVVLHIRESTVDENLERYLDQSSLVSLIRRYSNYIRYPITMDLAHEEFDERSGALVRDESEVERTTVNSMVPLWSLDESEVTEEETCAFYRLEFKDPADPIRTMRVRARGAIDYDAILFIPSKAPAELYTKDYAYGLRLYSSGVLVDDACPSLIPEYLRFVRGIVDTDSVNMNLSRQAIQEDGRIQIISRQIERSVLGNLKEMVSQDREGYEKFFAEFGAGIKYSICSSQGTLTELLNGLLLYWSAREGRLVSLQEYLDAAGDGKGVEIYYAVGSDIGRLAKSPAVQAVMEHGQDVLLCPNGAQDEMCFIIMGSYKGASFHSVTSANLGELEEETGEGPNEAVLEVLSTIGNLSPQPLIRVVASRCLTRAEQAASRVATEGLMTISMARYLSSKLEGRQAPRPMYVLEINVGHKLFERAEAAFEKHDEETLSCCAAVLLGQALLAEDIQLPDPVKFNAAVNHLL